ncbi:hypothetical protein L228DRAFT_105612 [Xylona heveae TC161]|uniref:Zn(2)-C6 fungal-type domain-containing protein n=1 Tax=Xylona heveae (strain CBS 132557 / TC161) TaxID=1328760 RepID=A0A165H987_XYLHT|nr:hypothetical protein L228DRAFT_105612 [Xylona heveae TC161]KZF23164.1 hypothetical protein L228DRAFT_105612 [Xylona heveae TC161]
MRSSIACVKCRRSKVKCINNGPGSICRSCQISGRECTYPLPAFENGTAGKRENSDTLNPVTHSGTSNLTQREEATKRKRSRKSSAAIPAAAVPSAAQLAHCAALDILGSPYLTAQLWMEIFDIFQLHFSADLPFFHPPTFLDHFCQPKTLSKPQNSTPQNDSTQWPQSPASPLVLLALLALTARFHPGLCAHHAQISPDRLSRPIAVSDYYAKYTRDLLTISHPVEHGYPSLERIQALLMLGLHEWGMCRGVRAWIYVGIAVRMAQLKGLQFEQDLDEEPNACSVALRKEAQHLGVSQSPNLPTAPDPSPGPMYFIDKEVKRRTFWSCFLMDRYMSSGKYRPQMLDVNELRVQLPSTERAFLFGEQVRTRLLSDEIELWSWKTDLQKQRAIGPKISRGQGTSGDRSPEHFLCDESVADRNTQVTDCQDKGKWEVGSDEGSIPRVIKIIEIWGRIAKWSCKGGRRTERYPPWHSRSTFSSLRELLAQFYGDLPPSLHFNHANLSAHIASRTSTPYTLMHTVYFLCLIILHREYVPFIPIRCTKPQGPLDEPTFPPDKYDIPPGWWESSARECFKAARDIMDMVRTCQDWGILAETPLIGFAIYTVAFVGVYCMNFPQMDPDGFMCSNEPVGPEETKKQSSSTNNSKGADSVRLAIEIIGGMRTRLNMADGWFRTVKRMHHYFRKMKEDYCTNTKALSSSSDPSISGETQRHLSIREGGDGGGLAEYKLLEKTLKEFGSLEDDEIADASEVEKKGNDHTPTLHQALDRQIDSAELEMARKRYHGTDTTDDRQKKVPRMEEMSQAVGAVPGRSPSASPYDTVGGVGLQRIVPFGQSPGAGVPPTYYPQLPQSVPPQIPDHQAVYPVEADIATKQIVSQSPPVTAPLSIPSAFCQSDTMPYPGPYPFPPEPPPPLGQMCSTNEQQPPQAPQQVSTSARMIRPSITALSPAGAMWTSEARKNWLDNLDTRLGGDDVAAFVDGSSCEEWGLAAGAGQGTSGWLSTVWGGSYGV